MRSRSIARWGLRLLLLVAALLLSGWILLQTQWGKSRVRDLAVRQAAAFVDGELTVDRLDGSLWSSSTLHGVRIRKDGVVVLSADRVSADYRFGELWAGKIVLGRLDVAGLDATVEQRADGWTVKGLAAREPSSPLDPGPTIALPNVRVTDSRVAIVPLSAPKRQLEAVSMDGSVMVTEGDVAVVARTFQGNETTGGLSVRRLSGTIVLADSRVTVSDLDLQTANSRLAGTFEMTGDPSVTKGRLTSDGLSLPEFAPYLTRLKDRNLRPSFDVAFDGPLAALKLTGRVASAAGEINADVVAGFVDVVTVKGRTRVVRLNLAPITLNPDLVSVLTGDATVDLRFDSKAALGATGTFDARLATVQMYDYAGSNARAKGRLTAGGLTSDVVLTAYGATTEAAIAWSNATRIFIADGTVHHLDMRQLPERLAFAEMETDANGAYHVEVMARRDWNLKATLETTTAEGATLTEGTVVDLQNRGDQMTYTATGRALNVDGQRLSYFLPSRSEWLRITPALIDGTFTVSGTGARDVPSHVLQFDYRDLRGVVDGAGLEGASGKGTLTHSRLVMSADTDISGDWSRLLLFPEYEIKPNGHLTADFVVEDVLAPLKLEVVTGSGRLTLGRSDLFGFDVTEGTVESTLTAGTFGISSARALANGLVATATGDFAAAGAGASNLSYVVDAADLSSLNALAGAELGGVGHAEGKITGSALEPVVTGTAAASQLVYDTMRALGFTSTYAVTAPEWDMTRLRGDVKAEGVFVEVSGQTLQRAELTAVLDGVQADVAAVLEQPDRRVNVNARLIVDADDREVLLQRADLTGAGETWTLAPGVNARLRRVGGRVLIDDLRLTNGDQVLTFAGILPMEATGSRTEGATEDALTVRAERVQVGGLSKIALGQERVTGVLNGDMRIAGSVADPRITSQFAVTQGTADGVPFNSFGGSVKYQPGGATVDVKLDAGDAGTLSAVGTAPVGAVVAGTPETPLNLKLTGNLSNAAVLGPALPWLTDLTGTANFDVTVTGAYEKVLANGTGVLKGVAFGVPELGTTYRGMDAAVRFEETVMVVDKFVVLDEDGHQLQINGSLDVLAGGPSKAVNLRVRATEFHLLNNDYGEMVVSADLTAGGDLVAPNVLGTIRVEKGTVEVDRLLEEYVLAQGYVPVGGFATRPATETPVPQTPKMFSQSAVSIELTLPDNVQIRGRGIQTEEGIIGLGDVNLTVGGLLRVTKSPGSDLSLLGFVTAVRGTYDFQGRRLAITRGSQLNFRGDDMTNPSLDITAEREIAGVDVTVRIRGTAAEPQLTLSSSPPLDEGDILALVAFGRPISQLADSQRASLAARAGTIAAGALATPLTDSVARALDLDVFEIQAGEGGTSSTAVVVGRQVSDKLFVGFRHEFGGEGAQRLTFEYQLTEFLRLVSTIAPGAQSISPTARTEAAGIDLIFVIRR